MLFYEEMTDRLIALDGLRGLAALSVFLSHAVGLMHQTDTIAAIQSSPLRTIWDGAAAVDLFFVLSGLVLARPFVATRTNPGLVEFYIRRAFRLYPAYWLAVLCSLALRAEYNPAGMSDLSDWARTQWTDAVTPEVLLEHLSLLLNTDTHAIDPVIWSLIGEMRMSILLPVVIVTLNQTNRVGADLAWLVVSVLLGATFVQLSVLPMFVLGALASKHLTSMTSALGGLTRTQACVVAFAGILMYGNRWIVPGLNQGQQDLVGALGSAVIIVSVLARPGLSRAFSNRIARFIGDTSYSFYLLHLPILLLVTSHLFPATGSLLAACLAAVAASYLCAYLVFRFVEQPGILAGRTVTGRWSRIQAQRIN